MDEGVLLLSFARGGLLLQNTSRCKNPRVFVWMRASSSLMRVEASFRRRPFPRIVRDMVAAEHSFCHTAAEMNPSDLSSAGDISLEVTTLVDSPNDCFSIPSKKLRTDPSSADERLAKAWKHWKRLGEPKLVVAPMVDQSELPFRMLCRKYGATAAYTPMLHSRLFADEAKYRSSEFTTCPEDRPLFVQFCSNDPEKLLIAAQIVEPHCDYVDINLGCPQRIAKRGNYGAFLMDDLPLVRSLVQKLASNLSVPVSCKIRIFPKLEDTLAYACMLEEAGCSLLAVHGRTREQKDSKGVRADWHAIKAVKQAVKIPVLANGNIRCLDDVHDCLRETGVDGVLSAESLLENPALFAGYRVASEVSTLSNGTLEEPNEMDMGPLDQPRLLLEYLDFFEKYPVPWRMVRAHVHRMLGNWFRIHPDLREVLNKEFKLSKEFLEGLVCSLINRKERIHLLPPSLPSEDSAKALASMPIGSSILLDAAIIGGNEVGELLVCDGLGNNQILSKDSRSTASMKMIGGLELS